MTPHELAKLIKDELAEALCDLELTQSPQVLDVVPPALLDAETSLSITIADTAGKLVELELPSSLAIGYLADEEAAVDEWRIWVQEIVSRLEV